MDADSSPAGSQPAAQTADFRDLLRRHARGFYGIWTVTIAAALLAVIWLPRQYRSSAEFILRSPERLTRRKNPATTPAVTARRSSWLELLHDPALLEQAWQPAGNAALRHTLNPRLPAGFRRRLRVNYIPRSRVVALQFLAANPGRAQKFLRNLLRIFNDRLRRNSQATLRRQQQRLNRQVRVLLAQRAQTQGKILAFAQRHPWVLAGRLSMRQQKWNTLAMELWRAEERLVERRVAQGTPANPEVPALLPLEMEQARAEAELARRNRIYLPTAAPVRQQQARIRSWQASLAKARAAQQSWAAVRLERRERQTAALARELRRQSARVAQARHRIFAARQLRLALRRQNQALAGLQASQLYWDARRGDGPAMRVLVPPLAPRRPITPRPFLDLGLSFAVGGGLALAFVFWRERQLDPILLPANEPLPLPVWAHLPHIAIASRGSLKLFSQRPQKPAREREPSRLPMASVSVRESASEAPRPAPVLNPIIDSHDWSSQLEFATARLLQNDARRIWAFTSLLPGEGKTTVAWAMARQLVALGQKVLVIQAHERQTTPAAGPFLDFTLEQWLANPKIEAFHLLPGMIAGITAGPAVIAAARDRHLPQALRLLAQNNIFVFLDAGAWTQNPWLDAWLRLSDMVLLVAAHGRGRRAAWATLVRQVREPGNPPAAMIANHCPDRQLATPPAAAIPRPMNDESSAENYRAVHA